MALKAPRTLSAGPARRHHAVSLVVVVALVAALSSCDLLAPLRSKTARPGWTLISADEFNGSTVGDRWKIYNNTYGDGNRELACLTPRNVSVAGGALNITARKERVRCPNGSVRDYSSGFLGTREVGRYLPRFARFEIKARVPHGQGLQPNFTLRHRDGSSTAAVDVMQYFHAQAPGQSTSTLHLDGRTNVSKKTVPFESPTANPGWHTWAVEISPSGSDVRFSFLLDDKVVHTYVDTQNDWTSADPRATWDMAVSLGVGGNWVGHPAGKLGYLDQLNRCAQGGTPPDGCRTTGIRRPSFPTTSTMQVDHIRVWAPSSTTPAPSPAPTPTTATPTTATPTTATPTTATPTTPAPTTQTPTTQTPTTLPPQGTPGWRFYSADEFDGSGVDASRFKAYNNTYGDGNNELACLTPNNVEVSGGSLKIRAKKEQKTCPSGATRSYTSGFLGTRDVGRYFPRFARFEIRAKLPHAQGLWPAFWLRHRGGSSVAEVDIMEYFHSQVPGQTTATLHLDQRYNLSKKTVGFEAPTASPGWHTWAVEITPSGPDVKFTFFLDGTAFLSYVDTQHRWTSQADAQGTWDMAINLAVGGTYVGNPEGTLGYLDVIGTCAQGGTPPNGCRTDGIRRIDYSLSTMEVDYVRVYVPS